MLTCPDNCIVPVVIFLQFARIGVIVKYCPTSVVSLVEHACGTGISDACIASTANVSARRSVVMFIFREEGSMERECIYALEEGVYMDTSMLCDEEERGKRGGVFIGATTPRFREL